MGLTFEEAFEIAKEELDKIDYCTEYDNGYHFDYNHKDRDGGDEGIYICKDGTILNTMPQFIEKLSLSKVIKKHKDLNYDFKKPIHTIDEYADRFDSPMGCKLIKPSDSNDK